MLQGQRAGFHWDVVYRSESLHRASPDLAIMELVLWSEVSHIRSKNMPEAPNAAKPSMYCHHLMMQTQTTP